MKSTQKGSERLEGHGEEIIDIVKGIETKYNTQIKINPVIFYPDRLSDWERESKDFYHRIARISGGKVKTIDDK